MWILSIAISIIDLNVHRWFTAKLMSRSTVNSHESRSVVSDGLTKYITNDDLTKYLQNSANKFGRKMGFKIKNEIEDHYQSIPKLTGMLTELRCIIGQNLEILTSTGGEWSCGQAQNCVNFDFQVKFHLEGQGQSTPKTIGMLTKLFCMSGSNLVILAGISDKLSRGQACDWRPHGQTQATTIPEGQNWPRVIKNQFIVGIYPSRQVHIVAFHRPYFWLQYFFKSKLKGNQLIWNKRENIGGQSYPSIWGELGRVG